MAPPLPSMAAISHLPILMYAGPDLVPNIKLAVVFGTSGQDAIFVTKDDEVYGIGANANGSLGVGDATSREEPTRVDPLFGKGVCAVVGGWYHVLALTLDGQVYAWGYNSDHELGNGNTTQLHSPQICQGLAEHKIRQITCGYGQSLALTEDGKVLSWGYNAHGQVGNGSTTNQPTPLFVQGLPADRPVKTIACCTHSSFALTSAGELYGWGYNGHGQLGINSTSNQTTPQRAAQNLHVKFEKISCGFYHVLCLTDEGQLYSCGRNGNGEVGVGSTADVTTPTHVNLDDARVDDTAASIYCHFSAAVTAERKVFVWGDTKCGNALKPRATTYQSLDEAFPMLSKVAVTYRQLSSAADDGDEDDDPSIRSCLLQHFDCEEVSNVHFLVEGQQLHGHLSYLRMRSPHLKAWLAEKWSKDEMEVKVEGYRYNVFKAYLRYLYTDELEVDVADAMEVLRLSDEYCEGELKRQCEKFVLENVTVENAFTIYEAAKNLSAKQLEDYCFEFIVANLTAACQTAAYNQLDPGTAHEFLPKAAKQKAFKH